MSVVLSEATHRVIRARLLRGQSIRCICVDLHVAKETVQKHRNELVSSGHKLGETGRIKIYRSEWEQELRDSRLMTPERAYHARATGRIYKAGMNYLSDLIVRPGIEKMFGPLLLYRGQMNYGHAHRLWNMALFMMAHECETLSDGLKIFQDQKMAQLCGPVRAPAKIHLMTFFTRLSDNPGVTRNITGFTDYVKSLGIGECHLIRVDRFSNERFCAPWRKSLHPNAGEEAPERGIPKTQQLFYPFLVNDPGKPDDGFSLVKLANAVVPPNLPEQMRADVCQDLIVAILAGDCAPQNARDWTERRMRAVWKEAPESKWSQGANGTHQWALSINQTVPGTEDMPMVEKI